MLVAHNISLYSHKDDLSCGFSGADSTLFCSAITFNISHSHTLQEFLDAFESNDSCSQQKNWNFSAPADRTIQLFNTSFRIIHFQRIRRFNFSTYRLKLFCSRESVDSIIQHSDWNYSVPANRTIRLFSTAGLEFFSSSESDDSIIQHRDWNSSVSANRTMQLFSTAGLELFCSANQMIQLFNTTLGIIPFQRIQGFNFSTQWLELFCSDESNDSIILNSWIEIILFQRIKWFDYSTRCLELFFLEPGIK